MAVMSENRLLGLHPEGCDDVRVVYVDLGVAENVIYGDFLAFLRYRSSRPVIVGQMAIRAVLVRLSDFHVPRLSL